MSVFQPVDPRLGNERRKALLARLTQSAVSNGAMGLPGAGRPFRAMSDLHSGGGHPHLTKLPPNLPPALLALLGPGGAGHPLPGEFSPAPGLSVAPPHPSPVGGPPQTPPAAPPAAPPGGTTPSAPVPLGNGLLFDPSKDVIFNVPGAGHNVYQY